LTSHAKKYIMYIDYPLYVMGEMAMQASISEVRENMADMINRVAYGGERVVLQRRSKGVAAMVSMDDLAMLQSLEDQSDVKAALRARKEKGSVPLAKIKNRLGMK
jgi:prevent-host-death family protein